MHASFDRPGFEGDFQLIATVETDDAVHVGLHLESEDQSAFDRQGSERETAHHVKTFHFFDCDSWSDRYGRIHFIFAIAIPGRIGVVESA